MAIARMADGGLVLHSAIALDAPGMAALDALGRVAFVVVPNALHRIDAPRFAARYPEAKVICPPGGRAKVAAVVRVDADYRAFPADPHVSIQVLEGTKGAEGVMVVRDDEGASLVFNDAIFNMPHAPGIAGFLVNHLMKSSGGPRVSRLGRLLLVKDRASFQAHLTRLAETPDLRRILVAHHETIASDPKRVLLEVAASL
jgi:hypothetical protein